jgi:hypothetical protein
MMDNNLRRTSKVNLANIINESRRLIREFIKRIRSWANQLWHNVNSWNAGYWLFFFGLVPWVQLSIPTLPQNVIDQFFILNQTRIYNPSLFLNNFSHTSISHLTSNLSLYYLCIAIIFLFEDHKKRFKYTSLIFLTLVPLLASFLTIELWETKNITTGTTLGFSAIAAAYFAYSTYLIFNWIYVNIHPNAYFSFNESSEFKAIFYLLKSFWTAKPGEKSVLQFIFIYFFLVWIAVLSAMVSFGKDVGQFAVVNGLSANGLAHFQGYMIGVVSPAIISSILGRKLRLFDLILLFSAIYWIWYYYTSYLLPKVIG